MSTPPTSFGQNYLESVRKQFRYYQRLGEKTFAQLTDTQLLWSPDPNSNSIAVIVKHLAGNMLSRWTDFLTTDGEKEWRQREDEFVGDLQDRDEVLATWEKGWACLHRHLDELTEADLGTIVYIRNMGHSVPEAINRQMMHYAYHVGQIVYLGRMQAGDNWRSLSIPKGGTARYNAAKFAREKRRSHFTDER